MKTALALLSLAAAAQTLDPASLLKPLSNEWPTYSGDYSAKRYSKLTQVTPANVKNLTLAWTTRITGGAGGQAPGGFRGFGGPSYPTIVGGEGTADFGGGGSTVRASPLMVDGVLYFSTPDNAWAVDARDGHIIWHYFWRTRGGTHIGNRGLGMWGKWLYMETPDNYLVCLDAATGKERWHKPIASFERQYFSTMAPIVVGNHILIGTGNDLDAPGYLQAHDPETGDVQWTTHMVPMKKGDPGLESWGTLEAARVGGGNVWIPGAYDPETKLYIFGTGNPTPSYTNPKSRDGDNLYTCSLVAINVDTGRMAWYYQLNPHDTHDWDSSETPILVDGLFKGKMRKMALHADRNGYFYVVDRTNGAHLLTSKFSDTVNWVKEINAKGQTIRDPEKDSTVGGTLVSPNNYGATNWPPAAYSPDTGLFYVPQSDTYAMYYLTETDPRGAMGLGGKDEQQLAQVGNYLTAIDYKTGRIKWRHKYPVSGGFGGTNGLLTTASGLLFGGDPSGNFLAFNAATGKILWHSRVGAVSNAPQTYLVDGKQHVLVAAGDTLFAFYLQ
ncbi:MAG: acido-empty-quinoprotein group A [Acidobacteria bacterium]|nr:acido-empty-quinoprotein group A [Acidobacteriota bacterium]